MKHFLAVVVEEEDVQEVSKAIDKLGKQVHSWSFTLRGLNEDNFGNWLKQFLTGIKK